MNATLHEADGRPTLRFERHYAHPIEAVWRAVSEPEQLAAWFPARIEADMRVGGRMTFTFPEGAAAPPDEEPMDVDAFRDGEVVALDPPRLFAFLWTEDLLRFDLTPEGDGCRLVFTHMFASADRKRAARDASGWHVCLEFLAAQLDGREPPAELSNAWEGLRDQYRAAFGVEL